MIVALVAVVLITAFTTLEGNLNTVFLSISLIRFIHQTVTEDDLLDIRMQQGYEV